MHGRSKDFPHLKDLVHKAAYTSVGKDGRVCVEPGLAPEVVRRQRRPQRRDNKDDDMVHCELKSTLKLSSEKKPDWLYKALTGLARKGGKAQIQDIFNILTHPKFVAGVEEWHRLRMLSMVRDHLDLFPERQQNCLLEPFRAPSRSRSHRRRAPSRPRRPSTVADTLVGEEDDVNRPDESVDHSRSAEDVAQQQRDRVEKYQAEREAATERDRQRKSKLGNAFALESEDEEHDHDIVATSSTLAHGQNDQKKSGGEVLKDVHSLLLKKAGVEKEQVIPPLRKQQQSSLHSRSSNEHDASGRRRRRRSRSPSHDKYHRSSFRSRTPEAWGRGQARAARKAKMIAMTLGMR
jgi:hypothetical protein